MLFRLREAQGILDIAPIVSFDATFRTNFVQIDILGHDDTDKVKFIFMASNVVSDGT